MSETTGFIPYEEFAPLYREVMNETRVQKLFSDELYDSFTGDDTTLRLYKISEKLVENAKKFNLTSILEPHEIVRKHLVDSLLPLGIMAEHGLIPSVGNVSMADVGCGAGFPSLPIAAASQDNFPLYVMGIDSTAKKITHIKETAEYANLTNIDGMAARAEELTMIKQESAAKKGGKGSAKGKNAPQKEEKAPYFRERFDITTARAVASLVTLLELCSPMTKVGGHFVALKSHADEEIAEAGDAPKKLGLTLTDRIDYELPGGDKRVVLIYEKVSATPKNYPRRYAEITKQPLK